MYKFSFVGVRKVLSLGFVALMLTLALSLPEAAAKAKKRKYRHSSRPKFSYAKSKKGPRAIHWTGFDIAFMQPFPSWGGVMIGFNLWDLFRISGGAGHLGSWVIGQGDLKIFFLKSGLAPYVGGGAGYITGVPSKFMFWDFNFSKTWAPYVEAGLDWTEAAHPEESAFHANINLGATIIDKHPIIMPGIAVGFYF